MSEKTSVEPSAISLESFERFFREVSAGVLKRNSFQPWEIELLLDYQQVRAERGRSEQLMRRYRLAARKYLLRTGGRPLKLSEYLAGVHRDRNLAHAGHVA